MLVCYIKRQGSEEQGAGNREQGIEEQGTGNGKAGNREQGTGNRKAGTGSRRPAALFGTVLVWDRFGLDSLAMVNARMRRSAS
jgi:hypothetical protein